METSRGLGGERRGRARPGMMLLSIYCPSCPHFLSLFLALATPSRPLLQFLSCLIKKTEICTENQYSDSNCDTNRGREVIQRERRTPAAIYQELWGAEYVQSEGLDPGVVDSQLPVDPRTFNTGEDAQVGGQPRRVWEKRKGTSRQWREGEVNDTRGIRGRNEYGWHAVLGQKPLKQK